MTEESVRAVLQQIAEKELGVQGTLPEGELAEYLDSVQRLTLVVAVEDHFQFCFEPEDESELRTLDDLVRYIVRRVG